VNGWQWGSGSHTNTVVALLHWKGVGGSEKVALIYCRTWAAIEKAA